MTKSDPEVRVTITSEQLAAWETRLNTLCRTGRGGPWCELSLSNDESRQLIAEVRLLMAENEALRNDRDQLLSDQSFAAGCQLLNELGEERGG